MADSHFIAGVVALGSAAVNLVSDTIRVMLCTAAWTANTSTHDNFDDIDVGARVAYATLSGKSFTGGVFDADNPTFTGVSAGATVTQIAIYKWTGTESTSKLLYRIDSYAGLPLLTDGTDITLSWPDDANKIFKVGA